METLPFEGGLRPLLLGTGFFTPADYQSLAMTCRRLHISDALLAQAVRKWNGTPLESSSRTELLHELSELQARRLYGYVPTWTRLDPCANAPTVVAFDPGAHMRYFPMQKDARCFIDQGDLANCKAANMPRNSENPLDFEPVCWTHCIRPVRFRDGVTGNAVDVYAAYRYPNKPFPPFLWRRVGGPLIEERPSRDPCASP